MINFELKSKWLFVFFVLIPTFCASIYNLIIASPIYVSESRVIIKSVGEGSTSGFLTFLKTFGISDTSVMGTSIIVSFVNSRDTMKFLDREFDIKNYYSKQGDFLSRFNPLGIDNSDEKFLIYYRNNIVNVWIDTASNIVTIQTRSFDGEYAYKLNYSIVKQAENFINLLNKRASITAMSYYEDQINKTRQRIDEASKKLVSFFQKSGVVSSEAQIMSNVQMITELQKQLTEKKLELSRIQSIAPESPIIGTIKEEIKKIESEVNKNFGILTTQTGKYSVVLELAKAELQTLQTELNANISAYIQAQNQAFMKHLFIETIQSPYVPDKALEPKKVKNIFTVFAVGFILWGIISLLIAGVKEHRGD